MTTNIACVEQVSYMQNTPLRTATSTPRTEYANVSPVNEFN